MSCQRFTPSQSLKCQRLFTRSHHCRLYSTFILISNLLLSRKWFKYIYSSTITWLIKIILTWLIVIIGTHCSSKEESITFINKFIYEIILALACHPIIIIDKVTFNIALYAHFFNPIIFDV